MVQERKQERNWVIKFTDFKPVYWKTGNGSQTYTLHGLGEDGRVYALRRGKGWVDVGSEAINKSPAPGHDHRRQAVPQDEDF